MRNIMNPERLGGVAVHQLLRKMVCLEGLIREYIGPVLEISKGKLYCS